MRAAESAREGGGVSGVSGVELLTPREVAEMFRVDPKTVTRWAAAGRLPCVRTPGGQHRFPRAEVLALLTQP